MNMKAKSFYIAICMVLVTLISCRQEEIYTGPCDVRFRAYVQDEVSVTRANYTYTTIGSSMPAFTAELFVTNGSQEPLPSTLTWNGQTLSSLQLEEGTYNFYGYMPRQDDATFDPATLTMHLPAIPGVSGTDAMVVKAKQSPVTIVNTDAPQWVNLQMDHLMAKVTPRFYLNSTYAQMRSIRIKKVEFGFEEDLTNHQATVTYSADNSYEVEWSTGEQLPQTMVVAYENENPTAILPTVKGEAVEYGCCYLCPNQPAGNLLMRVTYDVYDTKNECTRSDAVAVNKIKKLSSLTVNAGTDYKLSIQIVPNYLYALSDNDEEVMVISN